MATFDDTIALIEEEEYVNHRGWKEDDQNIIDQSDRIVDFINWASAEVKQYCYGRIFRIPEDQVSDDFYGDGTRDYFVKHGNITDTPSIQYYQSRQWNTTTRTIETDKDRGYIFFNDGTIFDKGTYWRVLYKPGYALADVPADLKGVCKVVVTRIFKSIEKEGVSSESFGDSQTNYNLENMFGKKELMTLDRYRRRIIG